MISIREALSNHIAPEAEILLAHVLKKNRAYLYAHSEEGLNVQDYAAYQKLLAERIKGVPIAYLLGERDFWSLTLKVNQHTLIPRHETELLVELVLEKIANEPGVKVLDLGTGSGAIALAIAKERPQWQIVACDKSQEALNVAKENAERNSLEAVRFYLSDWYSNLPSQRYNVIVANPPYIAENDPHLQEGDLRFEPRSALTSSQEGLADLELIIKQGYDCLLPNGLLLVEHGYDQKLNVRAILRKLGYKNVHCWRDIQGHDRVSGGWR